MKTTILAALAASTAAQRYPTFPNQWSAFTENILVQNQGNYNLPNGDYCCAVDSACQVQIQYSAGMTYFDLPNNRTSDVYGAEYTPYAIVSLFNSNMEAAVDSTFTCTSYCPLDEGAMEPYNVEGMTDMGPTTVLGKKVEAWQSIDQIPVLNITMETDTIYVDQSNFNAAVPIIEVDNLTPMGENIGQSNQTFTQWKAGAPDAKWFAVKGLSTCQQDSNCGSNDRQMYRLRTRQTGLFMKYAMAKKRAAAARAATIGKGFHVPKHMVDAAKAEHKARMGKHHRLGAKRHTKGDESDSDAE